MIYTDFGNRHALAENSKLRFYYGEGSIDETTQEWMFEVIKGGKVVFELTNSQLMSLVDSDSQSPKDLLLVGILAWLGK